MGELMSPDAAILRFEDVSLDFDTLAVLEGISLELHAGETLILLGPAGVGKSVLLKLANGLLKPTRGRIELFGHCLNAMKEEEIFALRARTGMVFQEGALFDSIDVRDNVAYQLIQQEVDDDEIDQRVRDALRFVELEHTFALYPSSLSGGMRRRVAIARALINHPELLLYDSPTGGLDPVTSNTIIELLVKQRDVSRTPSIVVTHRLQDATTLLTHRYDTASNHMISLPEGQVDPHTRFLILHEGRIAFHGSYLELLDCQDGFVQEFLA